MTSNIKYIGMDVHKEHADFPIMPNTKRTLRLGGARVAFTVGIIRGFPRRPTAGHQGGIAPV
jgi:hypothetical protein